MKPSSLLTLALVAASSLSPAAGAADQEHVTVGTKAFTESVVLGNMLADLARAAGADVQEYPQLGGTRILWSALLDGEIDIYPDYTGTITEEILADKHIISEKQLRSVLAEHGISMSQSLGFGNPYGIGVMPETAKRLNLKTISDLAKYPKLKFGFSSEFLDREDGWPYLKQVYKLPQRSVVGLEHDLAYRALESGSIDVTVLYLTDPQIEHLDLVVLEDNRHAFTSYDAVLLYRTKLKATAPQALASMLRLQGAISDTEMRRMNGEVLVDHVPGKFVAAQFLERTFGIKSTYVDGGTWAQWLKKLGRFTLEHLFMVVTSLSGALAVAIPLGIVCSRKERLAQPILAAVGVLQTIPSLALLVFMIPLLGIGYEAAIAALFLYSLLPIVRNTYAGLKGIPPALIESAEALGLPPGRRLWWIELPMALPMILAGIKTAAVINVGTATLGALIGAGGYGQPILTGIRLDNEGLILEGAVPAALMALAIQWLFEIAERRLVPLGLRLKRT
ncbi:Choline transport system permease protein OpuBB [Planctomycetes bacterium Pan216]|uniref:Choline transport system permease protein OpuBB n=1 Tax=Kolteria novifilia TaxID=2527975 RepID=A0A518B5H0_9BACT|nr:Choline transport system permease protein OpuBB [Planctomycetes bacterium Pan216]